MTSGMEDRHATDPPAREGNPSLSPTTTISWLSRSHPPTPHLCRSVAIIRSPATHPRLLGRQTSRTVGGPAPRAVTHLDEAGDQFRLPTVEREASLSLVLTAFEIHILYYLGLLFAYYTCTCSSTTTIQSTSCLSLPL